MFLENKYSKWYFSIIENAKLSLRKKKNGEYFESHHIIPQCMGGKEEVLLTAKEHFICHLLLPKMVEGSNKHKMINALIRMSFSASKGQKRYKAKSYSIVRALIAEKNSEMFKGVKKSEEMKKKLSASRKGIKYSEETKKKMSEATKLRQQGENNSFYGKRHNEETKKKWSEKRKGIKPSFNGKGSKWYTNGIEDKMCYPGNIPEGFYLGRSKNRKVNNIGS